MLAYVQIESEASFDDILKDNANGLKFHAIEKLVKQFKVHRSAIDFDHKFIKEALDDYRRRKSEEIKQ